MNFKKAADSKWTLSVAVAVSVGILISHFLEYVGFNLILLKTGQRKVDYLHYIFNYNPYKIIFAIIVILLFIYVYFKFKKK